MSALRIDNVHPYGDKLLLQQEKKALFGIVHVPDDFASISPMARVIRIGDGVPNMFKEGENVMVPSFTNDRKQNEITSHGYSFFLTSYINVVAKVFKRKVFPIGRRILIKRIQDPFRSELETVHNYQSLFGVVVQFGLLYEGEEFSHGLDLGDVVKLESWAMDQNEIQHPEHGYCLAVNETAIQAKYDEIKIEEQPVESGQSVG